MVNPKFFQMLTIYLSKKIKKNVVFRENFA